MSLYLLAGVAGSGKTVVCAALKARGFEAYDADDDGLARWQNNQTGYIHPKSSVKKEQRTAEFIADHSWNVPRVEAERLAARAVDKPVFLCGSLGNEDDLRDLFKKVFALYVDAPTLERRLATRTTGDWGKQPHELEQTLEWHKAAYNLHRQKGDVIIDTNQSLEQVVGEILSRVGVN